VTFFFFLPTERKKKQKERLPAPVPELKNGGIS
jgi:hypothetical protein